MFLRTAAFACVAALMSFAAQANAETPQSARCEDAAFRVYFDHGSATLSPYALETLNVAQRNMAGCAYAELHVTVDPASRFAAQRGQAILATAHMRDWNVARVEPQMMTPAAYSDGPEFVDVMMTSHPVPASTAPALRHAQPGV